MHSPHSDACPSLAQLDAEGDVGRIIFWLRSGLMRNLGNLTDARLFARFRTGSKAAVHEHQVGR